jgi:hypothetical protein
MPNAIVEILKFISAISLCCGRPTTEVFVKYYMLHYQQKKVKKDGSDETLSA